MCQKATISYCIICINAYTVKNSEPQLCDKAVAHFFGLVHFCRVGLADRNICVAALLLETAAQIIVAAVDSACTAFAFHIVVAVFGFDFITAKGTSNGVFDNQYESSFVKSSCIRCAP